LQLAFTVLKIPTRFQFGIAMQTSPSIYDRNNYLSWRFIVNPEGRRDKKLSHKIIMLRVAEMLKSAKINILAEKIGSKSALMNGSAVTELASKHHASERKFLV